MLNDIQEYLGYTSDTEFAVFLGISRQALSNWKKRKTFDTELLYSKCVQLDPSWLLTGKGGMLKKEMGAVKEPASVYNASKDKGIPLIPIDALASFGTEHEYQIIENGIEERYVVPDFDKVKPDYLIRVKGSSMYPKYNSGDVIAIRRVDHSLYIQWNKPYVLDTVSNGVMVKRIKQSKEEGCIKLVSDNKDYDPFDIPLSDVRSICLVVGVIRLE